MANAGVMLDLCVDGHSPLSGAVVHHRTAVVQLLLERGASVLRPVSEVLARVYSLPVGSTVLHLAARLGYGDVVSLLLHNRSELRGRAATDGVTAFQVG